MDEEDRKAKMAAIEARIAAAKGTTAPKPRADEHYSQAQMAWRMVIELVAGLGIGFGIGYGLDLFFGTLPIFMVLFVMLGLAAGVKTMLRSAQEMRKKIEEADALLKGDGPARNTPLPRGETTKPPKAGDE